MPVSPMFTNVPKAQLILCYLPQYHIYRDLDGGGINKMITRLLKACTHSMKTSSKKLTFGCTVHLAWFSGYSNLTSLVLIALRKNISEAN